MALKENSTTKIINKNFLNPEIKEIKQDLFFLRKI